MKTRSILLLALYVLGATLATAQTSTVSSMADMPMPTASVINGWENRDQITDAVAFRILMSDLYPRTNDTPGGSVNESLLSSMQLSPGDTATLRAAVIGYNKNLDKLVNPYNAQAEQDDANSTHLADQDGLYESIYALVANSQAGLSVSLSVTGLHQFSGILQQHKEHMTISQYDPGLGAIAKARLLERNMVASAGGRVPQGAGMTPKYSASWSATNNFPATSIYPSPFWSGWAQDTGSGSGYFTTVNNQVVATTTGTNNHSNAYWPAGGSDVFGSSTMTLGTPPYKDSSGNVNSICTRTNIANNGNTFYVACFFGGGAGDEYIVAYRYNNGTYASMGSYYSPAMFATGDKLTLQTMSNDSNAEIVVVYTPSGGSAEQVIQHTDTNPLPAGYVGIQECDCGGLGTFAGWYGGTGISITVTATVTGTTTGSGWPAGTIHTPRATLILASAGGATYGQGGPPNNYINYSSSVTYKVPIGTSVDPFNYVFEAGVNCSQAGQWFFAASPSGGGSGHWLHPIVWGARTFFILNSITPPINAKTMCDSISNPPDWVPDITATTTNALETYYSGVGICSRVTWYIGPLTGNVCGPPAAIVLPSGTYVGLPIGQPCTGQLGAVRPLFPWP